MSLSEFNSAGAGNGRQRPGGKIAVAMNGDRHTADAVGHDVVASIDAPQRPSGSLEPGNDVSSIHDYKQ
jgi:hypothetical protein